MMTFNDVVQAISVVGFPAVCCVVLFYEMHINNARREEELKSLRDILAENTNTLKELVQFLKEER